MKEKSGLFWGAGTTTSMTEQEVAGWRSPEQTGERLVETITAWLAHALEQLPAEWQWFRIDLERPDWIDPRTPEHALHELQRLMVQLPHAIPDSPPLEREQRRAVEVLMAARDTVEAVQGLAPARALVLIDNAINLGIAAARAHVQPWEAAALTGKDVRGGGDKGRDERDRTTAPMHQQWLETAKSYRARFPSMRVTDIAKKVVKEWNEQNPNQQREWRTACNYLYKHL
ncbi:hypothetical protein [Halomonas mongoliensis]|uniref:hypothetical protein n=1 Tax=Halomonas mongoliensis TaxID=321265 RepID=UPI00403A8A1B